ncbi:glucoside xylosyltransferase 1-like isoform X2 [Varroa destructor]|uniref:UDP-D-xylose:beta-D-glucoside alpha-1,3-D-xylosyltransferase n=1 Tax=Varroa destructor TaxID=109461 RepID=A0A7M7MDB2_VARDE|nr:glucoside xylosyltransferase 1-like isoform X2 [Varroa destructor]
MINYRERIGSTGNIISHTPLVALVSCQDRAPLTMVTLKSILMLSRRALRFVIFADRENAKELNTQISRFPRRIRARAEFSILPVEFPASARESKAKDIARRSRISAAQGQAMPDVGSEWQQLFKPCSAQRLFLPDLLKTEDSVLYVDTDTVFLRPVEQLWNIFGRMNESQIAAAAAESEDEKSGWYSRLARHPYVRPRGVNSGVMLLNLTRLRTFGWSQRVASVYEQWRERVVWGDQDIINIVFSNYSEVVYILPCEWNFRPDHCQYSTSCRGANRQGPGLLHGSRAVFTNNKQPAFRAIFKAFQQFTFRKKTTKLKSRQITKSNTPISVVRAHNSIANYRDKRQLSTNIASPADVVRTINGRRDGSDAKNVQHRKTVNSHKVRDYGGKYLKFNKVAIKSTDYDYIAEESFAQNGEKKGRQLNAKEDDFRENQIVIADEDDQLSIKERLINPLTIGIFETVNTRCGRFLKAHTKRITRALHARAADL